MSPDVEVVEAADAPDERDGILECNDCDWSQDVTMTITGEGVEMNVAGAMEHIEGHEGHTVKPRLKEAAE